MNDMISVPSYTIEKTIATLSLVRRFVKNWDEGDAAITALKEALNQSQVKQETDFDPQSENEQVIFQYRISLIDDEQWTDWRDCTEETAKVMWDYPILYGHKREARTLYTKKVRRHNYTPLTNEQIVSGLNDLIPESSRLERIAFNIGVRFAERTHGIEINK